MFKPVSLARYWRLSVAFMLLLALLVLLLRDRQTLVWALLGTWVGLLVWLLVGRLLDLGMSPWWLTSLVPPNVLAVSPGVREWLVLIAALPTIPVILLCLLRPGGAP